MEAVIQARQAGPQQYNTEIIVELAGIRFNAFARYDRWDFRLYSDMGLKVTLSHMFICIKIAHVNVDSSSTLLK